MSYARFGEDGSSVYVFGTGEYLICFGCKLGGVSYSTGYPGEMIAHIEQHRAKGDIVPDRAFERLREE